MKKTVNPNPRATHLRIADGWSIRRIPHEAAVWFVENFHYSKSATIIDFIDIGLIAPDGGLAGAAIWLPPSAGAAKWLANGTGATYNRTLNLSRLVVHPAVPTNGATFLMQGSLKLLRQEGYQVAVTYADSRLGHVGGIYGAANWLYAGETGARVGWADQDGRMRSTRAGNYHNDGRLRTRNLTVAEMTARGWSRVRSPGKARFLIAINRRFRKPVAAFAKRMAK